MPRLWVRIIRNHRIAKQDTCPCAFDNVEPALTEVCRQFDVPYPIWLRKHESEFSEFRRTAFLPEHFMEDVDFEKLEIEYLEDDDRKRRSRDPRNQF